MKKIHFVATLSLVPALANAQPESTEVSRGFDHHVAPVQQALEITVGTGYSQGGGNIGSGMSNLEDLAGPGAAFELGLGVRVIPSLTLGAYGSFAMYQSGDDVQSDTDVLGATAGLQAAYHFRPDRSVDPWVSLGAGWKGLWLSPQEGKTTSLQGFELARLQLGVDYRITDDIAISPLIGASLGMFVSQDSAMTTDLTEIDGKEVNFTGFAGVAGRFDLGGKR